MKSAIITDILFAALLLRGESVVMAQAVLFGLLWAVITAFFLRRDKQKGEFEKQSLITLWLANAFLTFLMYGGYQFIDHL